MGRRGDVLEQEGAWHSANMELQPMRTGMAFMWIFSLEADFCYLPSRQKISAAKNKGGDILREYLFFHVQNCTCLANNAICFLS